jgi:hypothetical protein
MKNSGRQNGYLQRLFLTVGAAALFLATAGFFGFISQAKMFESAAQAALATQTFSATGTGVPIGGVTPQGGAQYDIYEDQNRRLAVAIAFVNLPNGTPLTVEINGAAVGQANVLNQQFSFQLQTPEQTVPVVAAGSTLRVTNSGTAILTGTFELVQNDESVAFVGNLSGAKVLPPVQTDSYGTGVAVFRTGTNLTQFVVVANALTAPATGITINGPAATTENGAVIFNITQIFTTPDPDNESLFRTIGIGEFPLTQAQANQLNNGLLYVNVTNASNPNGFLRGQLTLYNTRGDFEGDGAADVSVFRPSNGTWYFLNSSDTAFRSEQFGGANDTIVPGDYDGDGKNDLAVFRRQTDGTGLWVVKCSTTDQVNYVQWGSATDVPVVGDFDGDNRDDIAAFRPSSGLWSLLRASDIIKPVAEGQSTATFVQWGTAGDKPFAGDFDGDGRADIAVFRPSDRTWYIRRSADAGFTSIPWGLETDVPLLRDFDGDGRVDVTVFRPLNGTWYIRRSSNSQLLAYQFGQNGDIPTAADFDRDGKADISVFRPSNGTWYGVRSATNEFFGTAFGLNGDVPTVGQ